MVDQEAVQLMEEMLQTFPEKMVDDDGNTYYTCCESHVGEGHADSCPWQRMFDYVQKNKQR